jgi:hypothetical protein
MGADHHGSCATCTLGEFDRVDEPVQLVVGVHLELFRVRPT